MRKITIFAMNEVMPSHGDMPGVIDTSVDDFLNEFKKHAHPIMRLGFFLAVWIYALSPIFTIGIPLPAMWLSEQKRKAHLRKYSSSKSFVFSQLWMLQKMITGMAWGMDDKVRAYFGYEPYPEELGLFKKGDTL
jgi:hypothetical protein